MAAHTRREFVKSSLALSAASWLPGLTAPAVAAVPAPNKLGMFIFLDSKDPDKTLRQVAELGFPTCEIYTEDFRDEVATALRQAMDRHRIAITALFTMGPGPLAWDFYEGPARNGLVPREWRAQRIARLKQASDFAQRCGIPAIETEAGFIPENPNDPFYKETIEALRDVIGHCRTNRTIFLYHAGSETAVTMLRVLQDVGLDNQGVGLDTANPILYGTGHPCDALEVYGRHARAVNAKDGLWPTDPRHLGKETPIGEGKVDFPRLLKKLRELNYAGPITIERESSGPEQLEDIKKSKAFLERLLK
jgi:sugar phosphate isomerase/epimerase